MIDGERSALQAIVNTRTGPLIRVDGQAGRFIVDLVAGAVVTVDIRGSGWPPFIPEE